MEFTLLVIALLGALAVGVSRMFRRFVPEIVVFLALGILIGPEGPFRLIHAGNVRSLELVTQVALAAIIFLIGDRLRLDRLEGSLRLLVPLNIAQIAATGAIVFLATRAAGADATTAFVLGLIAAETGVLTVTATVAEERADGPFSHVLLSSVALTNVGVAMLFGLAFPFVLSGTAAVGSNLETAVVFLQIVVASTLIGLAAGWLLATASRNVETSGELLLTLLITLIGITGAGIAVNGSVVIAALVTGLYIANVTPWLADRLFAAVRTLEAPIYLVFFVVAGASIHLDELATVGLVGAAYILARTSGKIVGSALGAVAGRGPGAAAEGLNVGIGLLPHAGMAIALVAFVVEQSPALGEDVSAVILGSIVVFELAGPLATRYVLRRAGETRRGSASAAAAVGPDEARTFKRVLIPVGSVEVVLPRLGFLLDLVASLSAELIAVHVSRPGTVPAEDEPEALQLVAQHAAARGLDVRTVHAVSEEVASTLVDAARSEEADLIVMGEPARRSFLEPMSWGSISQRVFRLSPVPILVYAVDTSAPGAPPAVYMHRAGADES